MRWTLDEILVAVAFFVLFYFRNWQATVPLLGVMAYLLIRYFEEKEEPNAC